MTYDEFLATKKRNVIQSGFDISEKDLNPKLFDFQKFTVRRALKAGKYAIFADTGQGKTPMQLEIADKVFNHTKKPVLILAPLAVSGQTIKEGEKFGIKVNKWTDGGNIQIANYEQLDNISCDGFSGVVLDESSILKNKTRRINKQSIRRVHNTTRKV